MNKCLITYEKFNLVCDIIRYLSHLAKVHGSHGCCVCGREGMVTMAALSVVTGDNHMGYLLMCLEGSPKPGLAPE